MIRPYVVAFLVLYVALKLANAGTAFAAELPPFAFRPLSEALACAVELTVLWTFVRRRGEDVFLANLGVSRARLLGPLALLHLILSGLVAWIAA